MHVKLDSNEQDISSLVNESVFRPDNASDIALINHLAGKSWFRRSLVPSVPSLSISADAISRKICFPLLDATEVGFLMA